MSWAKGKTHRFHCDHVPAGDYKGPGYCTAEFRSASVASVLVDQLIYAGWSVVTWYGCQPWEWRAVKTLTGQVTRKHYCPEHRPAVGRMTAARVDSG